MLYDQCKLFEQGEEPSKLLDLAFKLYTKPYLPNSIHMNHPIRHNLPSMLRFHRNNFQRSSHSLC